MCAQRRVVAGDGILPIGLARTDGIEEMAKVRDGWFGAFALEMLGRFPGALGRLDFGGDHLGSL
jgi:hypothetical protein